MKRIALAAAALLASVGFAQADPYSSFYGNSLTITAPDGSKTVAYVNADMTWETHLPNNAVGKGTYVWKDAQTACFTQADPAPKSADMAVTCFPAQTDHKVGDTWSTTDSSGKTTSLSLTAGR
jgi:hypothetical protein